jgi:hypothetical protein
VCANALWFVLEMLWGGIDKTMAELLAHHLSVGSFEGNPRGRFRAVIDSVNYGPTCMPGSVGLYGERYTIEFRPGESVRRGTVILYDVMHFNIFFACVQERI